jgi:AAA domain
MIRERAKELARLYSEHAPREEHGGDANGHRAPAASSKSDEEIIEKICSERGGKFEMLMGGDLSDYDGDHSRADDAFVHKLWSYTQDPEQVKRIHAMSGLHRPEKSGRRFDYLERSITRAQRNVTWFYEWPEKAFKVGMGGAENHSAVSRDGVPAEGKIRFRTAREVAAATPAETEWIAYPYVATGAITEVDGKIKAGGKTTWISHMAACVLEGAPFMGEPTTKTKILFLTEQQPTSFRKVLERAGLTMREDLYILPWHEVAGMPWSEVARHATEKALELGAGVIMVDTLGQFAGLRGDRENDAGAAQEAMRPLQVAASRGLAVVLTRHERKGGGEVGESGRGSSAYGGAVDIILSIRRAEGNVRPTVRVIESLSRFEETPDKLVIELTPDGYRSLGDATAFAEKEARQAILDIMPAKVENAITMRDLVDKVKDHDVKRTAAQETILTLIAEGTVTRIGAGKKGDPYLQFLSAGTPSSYTAEGNKEQEKQSTPVQGKHSAETPAGSARKKDSPEKPPSVNVDSVNHVHREQLTVVEVLEEIARPGSEAGQGVELLRNGEIGEEDAVEWITKAILHRRSESWAGWEQHAAATREALERRERDDD